VAATEYTVTINGSTHYFIADDTTAEDVAETVTAYDMWVRIVG
jgi:hypothetical protein